MKKIFTISLLFILGVQFASGQVIVPGKFLSSSNFTGTLKKVEGQPSKVAKQTERNTMDTLSFRNPIFSALLADKQKSPFERNCFVPVIHHIKINPILLSLPANKSTGISAAEIKVTEVPQNKYIAYGTTGSVLISAGYGARQKASAHLNLTHRTRKLALFADYNFQHNHFRQVFHNYRKVTHQNLTTQTWDTVTRNPLLQQHTLHAGMEYTLSSRTRMNALLSGFTNTVTVDDEAIRTNMLEGNQAATPAYLTHLEKNQWRHVKGIFSINHQFSKGQEVNIELGYLFYNANNAHQFAQINIIVFENTSGSDPFTIHRKIPVGVKVGAITYTKNFSGQSKLEAGLKGTMASLGNDLNLERFQQDQWQKDSAASYQLNRNEQIGAAYLAITHPFNAKTKLQASLRWEYTHTQVNSARQEERVQRSYSNLLPVLMLSREFPNGKMLQLSYNRSIIRPTYNNLAAYIFPTDPFSGNISLRPSVVDVIDATYRLKETYQATLGYSYHSNPIVPLQFHINPQTNQQYAQAENFKNAQNFYLMLSMQTNLTPRWQIQGKATGGWQQNRALYEGMNVQVQKMYGTLSIIHNFRISNDFSAELTGIYQTPSLFGIGYLKSLGGLNIGLQKQLKNNLGALRLTVEDILGTMGPMLVNQLPALQLNHTLRVRFVEPRIFRLTYSRTFGNLQVKRLSHLSGTCEEEANRATK